MTFFKASKKTNGQISVSDTGWRHQTKIESGKTGFKDMEVYMLKQGGVSPNTGCRQDQDFLENLITSLSKPVS